MRDHLRSHVAAWLLIAALVITANEVIDRVFFDEYHIAADIAFAFVAVAIAAWVSYAISRRRTHDAEQRTR